MRAFFWAVVFLMLNTSFSQEFPTDKGSWLLTGNFIFAYSSGEYYEDNDGESSTHWGIEPNVSYFVSPAIAIGGVLLMQNISQGDYSRNTVGIGPQLFYFIGGDQPREKFKGTTLPFLNIAYFYINHSYEVEYSDWDDTFTRIRLGGGMMYMVTSSAALSIHLTYNIDNYKYENGSSDEGTQLLIYAGFSVFIY